MKVSRPLDVSLPAGGVLFAESVHAPDFAMPQRVDPFHKLIYVLRGGVVCARGEPKAERIEIAEGGMVAIKAGCLHRLDDRAASVLLLLCLDADWVARQPERARLWDELAADPRAVALLDRPSRLRSEAIWRRAMAEQTRPRPGGGLLVRGLADQALVWLARRPSVAGTGAADRVRAVAREIEETFFDEWSLDRAAARAGLSRRRFSELFRIETSNTLLGHLTEVRLQHARTLLVAAEHSVMGVMFSCGFNDVSHFYRLYRRRFGEPPGKMHRSPPDSQADCLPRRRKPG